MKYKSVRILYICAILKQTKSTVFMKYYSLLIITIYLFSACTKKNTLEESSTKDEYLDKIEKLSEKASKKQIEEDVFYLTELLNQSKDLRAYNRNVARTKDQSTDSILVAEKVTLPSRDLIEEEFAHIKDIVAFQKYGTVLSSFDFKIGDTLNVVNPSEIGYNLKSVFVKNDTLAPSKIALTAADSIFVDLNYRFVTHIDSIIIDSKSADSIIYKKTKIAIITQSDESIKLIYPTTLSLIDYRAYNKDDEMPAKYKTYSDFSIFGISKEVQDALYSMADKLKNANQAENKDQCLAILKEIPEQHFLYLTALRNFKRTYDKEVLKNENNTQVQIVELPADLIKEFSFILAPVSKELTLTFSKPYEKVVLYVASKFKTLEREMYIPIQTDPSINNKVFKDNESLKYGILNKDFKIIIPATYESLIQLEDLYYKVSTPDDMQDVYYYLDTNQQKLVRLPNDLSFVRSLNSEIAIFENSKRKKGLLSNNKIEIVPFRYDEILIHGKTIIARGTSNGKIFYELFNIGGKKISLPQISEVQYSENNPNIIVRAIDGQEGVINAEGVLAIRPQYYGLKFLNDKLLKYNMDQTYNEYSTNSYQWGIVTLDGKVISKPTYYSIGFFSDGMATVYIKEGDVLRGGYIDEAGKVVVEPKFLFVNQYYKGYALVRQLSSYCLINKNGRIIKNFSPGTYVELVDYEDSTKGSVYETSDGTYYNYEGKLVK